jgi:antitoxin HigA-1
MQLFPIWRLSNHTQNHNKMQPENRIPTHPGEVLLEEFLLPLEIPQLRFAAHLGIPVQRVNEIVREKRSVTPETA